MKFSEACIRRPVFTAMLNLALIVFGFLGLQRLPVRELPDIDPAIVTVLTVYPGASAEVVETEITERVEGAVSSASGIKLLTSAPVKNACVQGIACGMRVKNCYQDMVEQAKANVDDMVAEAAYITQSEAAADEAAE